jgi:hypothetical protein
MRPVEEKDRALAAKLSAVGAKIGETVANALRRRSCTQR